jgi:hypothetical protein
MPMEYEARAGRRRSARGFRFVRILICFAVPICPVLGQEGDESSDIGREGVGLFDLEAPLIIANNLSGRGLLDLDDPYPLAGLHLELPTNPFVTLAEGHAELTTAMIWSSSFGLSSGGDIEVDAEVFRFRVSGWYALSDAVYVGAAVPLVVRGPGVLDPLVDRFHSNLGLSDGGRNERSRNDYEIRVTRAGKTSTLEQQGGLGNASLAAHWNIHPGGGSYPGVAVQTHLSLPTASDGLGSDDMDFGVNVAISKEFLPKTFLHLVAGGSVRGDVRTEGLRYERYAYQLIAGIEWAVREELSLILESVSLSPLLEGTGFVADPRGYLGFGAKWEFTPAIELELGFIENVQPFKNSADVSFNAAFTFHL